MDFKEEWLRYSGLNEEPEDIWLRDLVASLIDIAEPDEEQAWITHMAGLRLTLFDLPAAAYPNHKEELMGLARKYAARRTETKDPSLRSG